MTTCSIDTCERQAVARGWCGTHWKRWSKHGSPLLGDRHRTLCSVAGCQRIIVRQKFCGLHWQRFERLGSTELPQRTSPVVRLLSNLTLRPDGCWDWLGYCNRNGYGQAPLSVGAVYGTRLPHRAAYIQLVGPIPDGLHLDHLCRNKRCMNPSHLEPVTPAENNQRAVAARRPDLAEALTVPSTSRRFTLVKDDDQ